MLVELCTLTIKGGRTVSIHRDDRPLVPNIERYVVHCGTARRFAATWDRASEWFNTAVQQELQIAGRKAGDSDSFDWRLGW